MHWNIPRFGRGKFYDLEIVCKSESVGIVVLLSTTGKESVVETNAVTESIAFAVKGNARHDHRMYRFDWNRICCGLADTKPVRNEPIAWRPWTKLHISIIAANRQNYPPPCRHEPMYPKRGIEFASVRDIARDGAARVGPARIAVRNDQFLQGFSDGFRCSNLFKIGEIATLLLQN